MKHPASSIRHRFQIHSSVQELQTLQENGFSTIPKLNWWLLKYEALYKFCKDNWNNGSCFGELPCSRTMNSDEDEFWQFYEALEEVTALHKHEPYLREQMELLETVRDDHPALMQWLKRNETLGTEDLILFWIEWLEEPGVVDPNICHFKELKFKFSAEVFENTIRFLEVFNEIYWTSDACSGD